MKIHFLPFLLVFFLFGCGNGKKALVSQPTNTNESPDEVEVIEEYTDLDTMVISAPKPTELKKPEEYELPVYKPSYHLRNNLLHTRLEVSFDWPKQYVLGKAVLSLKPYFYPANQLELDAVGFDLHKVTFDGSEEALKYDYDGKKLKIDLGRTVPADETYKIRIDYTAKPAEQPIGGSAAITSDQGLFFINPDNSLPDKPMQIWTQGETEFNSRWFPTIDKPNERCTQETYVTVEDRFKTLSNGTLISSTPNSDGTRTDYWKMDLPHAPYLFMLAIGEFAVVKDEYKGKPVEYYVEPEYEAYARDIYPNTLPMLKFFSEKLGYEYPWSKYSQVVVRDYVSGAMENTTGVIFGEFMQGTDRELIDVETNELIVAHEMIHHWFGDLVTCESWANLTMNEGFANYGEYLWLEHQYGKEEADRHRFNELNGYLGSTRQAGIHPLIYFAYKDKGDMFDAHSYNKGGLVLHMLRNYVGDEAFWAGLSLYLKQNEYTAVEAHDLRLAFEEVTGEDLNWFFNQWYFNPGHPVLDIQHDYDSTTNIASVRIEQLQNPEQNPPIFILPIAIDIYDQQGKVRREEVRIDKRLQTFEFKVDGRPALVNVDADKILLAEKNEEKEEEVLIFQYKNTPNYLDRQEALASLSESSSEAAQQTIALAINDPFWSLRRGAIRNVDPNLPGVAAKLALLAQADPKSQVRATAIGALGATEDAQYADAAKKALKDPAYPVISAALNALSALNPQEALAEAAKLENAENGNIITAVAEIYAQNPKPEYLPFYEKQWNKVDGYGVVGFFEAYGAILSQLNDSDVLPAIDRLAQLAKDPNNSSLWRRFAATKTLSDLRENYGSQIESAEATRQEELKGHVAKITELINDIKAQEKDPQLKAVYSNF
ncbi:MAG: M1 family aminopeptidase [Bacteroidota bacterium]